MKRSLLPLLFALLAAATVAPTAAASLPHVAAAAGGDPHNPVQRQVSGGPRASGAVYRGTMTTTVEYFDACGKALGSQRTQIAVGVVVGAKGDPARLLIGEPSLNEQLAPGSISLASAQRGADLHLQYWHLAFDGDRLEGTLVDDHREERGAYNLLSALQQLIPCQAQFGYYPSQFPISEGSRLSGTVGAGAIELKISGNVLGGSRPFVAEIAATRAQSRQASQ